MDTTVSRPKVKPGKGGGSCSSGFVFSGVAPKTAKSFHLTLRLCGRFRRERLRYVLGDSLLISPGVERARGRAWIFFPVKASGFVEKLAASRVHAY